MMWMMMLIMFLSTMMIMIKHPLSMGLIILAQTTLITLLSGMMSQNFWFSYILFLIMVGGLLILFIYMTSIASNEKFSYKNKYMFWAIMILLMIMLTNLNDNLFLYEMMKMNDSLKMSILKEFTFSLNKFLNYPNSITLMLIISYLLITLIAIVKITNIENGPLRQK